MDYNRHLRSMPPSLCDMVKYGEGPAADVSLMALMMDCREQDTEYQQQQPQLNIMEATITPATAQAPSFANYYYEPYLQQALFQPEPEPHFTLEHLDGHAAVISTEEAKADLASKLVHGAGQFSGAREANISKGFVNPDANSTTYNTRSCMDTHTSTPTDHPDHMIREKIIAHPTYPRLVVAYVNCHKIGAPLEVAKRLNEVSRKCENSRSPAPSASGADPELDDFMENYCDVLQKYHEELTQSFEDAMAFFRKIQLQLKALNKESWWLSQTDLGLTFRQVTKLHVRIDGNIDVLIQQYGSPFFLFGAGV